MATHAHYMAELNNIFQYKWIMYDSNNSMYFMATEYRIKSNYKMSNNVCILYTGMPIIKNTRSCIITEDEHDNMNLNITITKPLFGNTLETIVYNITAIKASSPVWYTVVNSLRVVHPQYMITNRMLEDEAISFCSKIVDIIYGLKASLTNQIHFLEENVKKNLLTMNFLHAKLNKLTQKFILDDNAISDDIPDEPHAKRKKHY